jgi:hypothetical protein
MAVSLSWRGTAPVLPRGPVPVSIRSSATRCTVRRTGGLGIGPEHVRQHGPHAWDQDRRQDTTVVIAHGARALLAWAIR